MRMAFLTQECRASDRKERHMTTMTTYQTALRERVLQLAARRPLIALAREMQVSRNTLSAWVPSEGAESNGADAPEDRDLVRGAGGRRETAGTGVSTGAEVFSPPYKLLD